MRCADENQLVMLVRVEGSKSEAAEKCRQGKCILLTSLFIDERHTLVGVVCYTIKARGERRAYVTHSQGSSAGISASYYAAREQAAEDFL